MPTWVSVLAQIQIWRLCCRLVGVDPCRWVGGIRTERKLKSSVDTGVGDARGRRFPSWGRRCGSTPPPSSLLRVKTLVFDLTVAALPRRDLLGGIVSEQWSPRFTMVV